MTLRRTKERNVNRKKYRKKETIILKCLVNGKVMEDGYVHRRKPGKNKFKAALENSGNSGT